MKNKALIIFILFVLFSCTSKTKQKKEAQNKDNPQEQAEYGTGLVFNDEAYSKIPMKATLTRSLYGNVPNQFSLKQFCPTAWSQQSYGTCVGWASANARTILYARNHNITNNYEIDRNRYSPLFIYRLIKSGDNNCQHGSYIEDAVELMKNTGVVPYSIFDYLCAKEVPSNIVSQAKDQIEDYTTLFEYNGDNQYKIQATKKSISEGNPVLIGMKCPGSFHWATGVWEPSESYIVEFGGHAMCIIGYDDNKYGGAFELLNSWGTDWGNKGYIWVKYQDYANFTRNAYELINNIKYEPEPSEPDLSGKLKFVTSNNREISVTYQKNRGLSVVSAVRQGAYKTNQSYSSGTKFRLYITNNEPAYVYAISSDNTMNINQLFPHKPEISPILNYSSNEVAIPDEDHFIQMDNVTGTDIFCLLYSKEELNIETIISKIKSQSGNFPERLDNTLASKLVDASDINFDDYNISFSAFSKGKIVVPVIIEIEHSN